MLPYNENLKQRSKQLRNNMTDAEKHLWTKLRMGQLKGCHFYRQKPIGEYIVDFFCPRAKLVVEVDGGQHFSDETIEYDKIRDEYMRSLGLKVLRFTNTEVMKNIDGVVESINENMSASREIPLSPPFPKGETKHKDTSPFYKRENERDFGRGEVENGQTRSN